MFNITLILQVFVQQDKLIRSIISRKSLSSILIDMRNERFVVVTHIFSSEDFFLSLSRARSVCGKLPLPHLFHDVGGRKISEDCTLYIQINQMNHSSYFICADVLIFIDEYVIDFVYMYMYVSGERTTQGVKARPHAHDHSQVWWVFMHPSFV